eukprot:709772-Pyramimonas_sp.AAC.1
MRRLYQNDEHPMVAMARAELAKAEATARASMAPDDLLRSAKDRLAAKEAEHASQTKRVAELQQQLDDGQKRLTGLAAELSTLQAEVAQAQAAVAAAAAEATARVSGQASAAAATDATQTPAHFQD